MQMFKNNDGWNTTRTDLIFTLAMLQASVVHGELAQPLEAHLGVWSTVEADRVRADDALTKASARVVWVNVVLDEATVRFSAHLLIECGQNRAHPTYARFFPAPVNEVVRLGLESQLTAMEKFPTLAEEFTLSNACAAALNGVLAVMTEGESAVAARDEAETALTRVSVRQSAWRDEANTLRRKVETGLADHATDQKLARAYPSRFFRAQRSDKATAKTDPQPAVTPVTPAQPAPPIALTESDHVLALPDVILRGLADDFVATLPANVQAIVRTRRTG